MEPADETEGHEHTCPSCSETWYCEEDECSGKESLECVDCESEGDDDI